MAAAREDRWFIAKAVLVFACWVVLCVWSFRELGSLAQVVPPGAPGPRAARTAYAVQAPADTHALVCAAPAAAALARP